MASTGKRCGLPYKLARRGLPMASAPVRRLVAEAASRCLVGSVSGMGSCPAMVMAWAGSGVGF